MANERLEVLRGGAAGDQVLLDGEFVVGRGETGQGTLADDTEISRRHARFYRTSDGRIVVEDLGSTNGTFVNGRRVDAPTVLSSGDEIQLGQTLVRFDGGTQPTGLQGNGQQTLARTAGRRPANAGGAAFAAASPPAAPPASAAVASPPPPTAAATAPPAAPPRPAPRPPTTGPPASGPRFGTPEPRVPRILRDAFALAAAAAAVVAITLITDHSPAGDCGANIGKHGPVQFVSYVETNKTGGGNAVLEIPFGPNMKPQSISQCATGGAGGSQLKMAGSIDGNDQIVVNPQQTLLFAVNQGSDSIAVFHIQPNGGLQAVAGSPFPSGGVAPSSLGLAGSTLIVSNKARDGVRNLVALPNFSTFRVNSDGTLTHVSTIPSTAMAAPTSAVVSHDGTVVFGLEDGGGIRSFSLSPSGALTQAPGSPYHLPASAFAVGTPPPKEFALGVRAHPSQPYVYMTLPTVPSLAVFSYAPNGALTYIRSVPTIGAYLPCWIQITNDGHWLYTSSAGTDNVTAFDISNPRLPKQIQDLPFGKAGNSWNIQLDPTNKYLVEVAPRAVPAVPLGKGNVLNVMRVGANGTLTEAYALNLPVSNTTRPNGLAVVKPKL